MKKWSIKKGNRKHGGYVVKLTTDQMEVGSFPVIKNPWLRFMYPWAIYRAMRECKKLVRSHEGL